MIHEAENAIREKLDADEELVWAGMPKQGFVLQPSDTYLIPFSLMWGGFAIFWEVSVLTMNSGEEAGVQTVFALFGIPFVLVGLYIIFGRFIHDAKIRSKTYYGLTNDRIIIISGLFQEQVKSLSLKTTTDISMTERANGFGSITFGQDAPYAAFIGSNWLPGIISTTASKFEMIENPKEIYDVIRSRQ